MLPRDVHSQQAGTILSTLMRSRRGMPPQCEDAGVLQACASRSVQILRNHRCARMIWNSISSQADGLPKNVSNTATKVAPENGADQSSACRVALIGFGTVGRAVAKILCESGDQSLQLTHICNRNVAKQEAGLGSERCCLDRGRGFGSELRCGRS